MIPQFCVKVFLLQIILNYHFIRLKYFIKRVIKEFILNYYSHQAMELLTLYL
jgi:hypothetical protein